MKKPIVVIPTYNEADNVEAMATAVLENLENGEVLFVDDNSPDGTGTIVDKLASTNPKIHIIHRPGKLGLGRAYITGFKWAIENGFTHIFEMDCDFSHDPADLPKLLAATDDADLVLGSRYIGGIRVMNWPLKRLLISTFGGFYVRTITGLPIMDPTGGYKCFTRKVLETIELDKITSNGYSFQVETTHKAWMKGFKIIEVPIMFIERRAGQSKMSGSIAREAFWKVWQLAAASGFRRSPRVKQ